MIKKLSLILILTIARLACGASATVTNYAELNTAINDACTPIHLNAQTFTVNAGWNTIDHACTIDNVFGSDVTIDFQDARNPIIRNATVNIVGSSGARIIWTQTQWSGVEINSTAGATVVIFTYNDFTDSNSGSGLSIQDAMNDDITVTCNNCRVISNKLDGFVISSTATAAGAQIATLTLNDCEAYDQDPGHSGGGAGDGIGAHLTHQYIYMNGGSSYLNHKSGVVCIGGSSFFAKDASFYDNSLNVAGGQVLQDAGYISLENCSFYVTGSGVNATCFLPTDTSASVVNCDFNGTNLTSKNLILAAGDCQLLIVGNNFYDNASAAQYGISLSATTVSGVIANNTINNITNDGINLASPDVTLYNNIISNCGVGIHCPTYEYDTNPLNEYNCFYNNTANFSGGSSSTGASNDITTDPALVNAANGDFRLKPTSSCINAGKPTIEGGRSTIGAWQPYALTRARYRARYGGTPIYK